MPARLLELTCATCAEDLAVDDLLLNTLNDATDDDRVPVLRLWERPDDAVVLGRSNRAAANVDRAACDAAGVPVLRRSSGGGTVLLGPGCLCFTLVWPVDPGEHLADIATATAAVMGTLADALAPHVPGVGVDGTSDLTIPGATPDAPRVKVGGNAQRWLRRAALHHGTLLYGFDLPRIGALLTPPERRPAYRRDRGHTRFVTNLPVPRETLRSALIAAYEATLGPPAMDGDAVERSVRERYSTAAWTWKR